MPARTLVSSRFPACFSIVSIAFVLAAAAAPRPARAQTPGDGFALDRFEPAGGGSRFFSLESLDFRGKARPAISLFADYAKDPLVIYDERGEKVRSLVGSQTFLHLGFAINLLDRARLGLSLPVALAQGGDGGQVGTVLYSAPDGAAAGDLRVSLDVLLFGRADGPIRMALGAQVFAPTGSRDSFTGDGKVRVAPRLLVAGDLGPILYAVRAGYQFRSDLADPQAQGFDLGSELAFGGAAGVKLGRRAIVGPELYGATLPGDDTFFKARGTPVELLFGANVSVGGGFHVGVGAAPGLTRGVGSPALRVLGRLEYFPPMDRDGDRIADEEDACPDQRGARTNDPATNGCPDRDGDGVLDREDACPDQRGARTDDLATNGCPDRDGDGVFDREDACPDVPGPRNGDPELNGCPDKDGDKIADQADACPDRAGPRRDDPRTNGCPDSDGDGILDREDACPDRPGAPNDDPAKHGCPDDDRDRDGILNAEDACPDEAGARTTDPATNGCPDRDGDKVVDRIDACPDVPGIVTTDPKTNGCPPARVEKGQIRIADQVKFKTNSATILPVSDYILEAVSRILRDNPEITKVRVEGHTDSRGADAYNKKLSARRAASVMKWLTTRGGIAAARLHSVGWGEERPIADNKTNEGRQENRRVEFHIVEPAQQGTTP